MKPLIVYHKDPYVVLDTSNGAGLAFQVYYQTGPAGDDGSAEYERLPVSKVVIFKTLDAAKAAIAKGQL